MKKLFLFTCLFSVLGLTAQHIDKSKFLSPAKFTPQAEGTYTQSSTDSLVLIPVTLTPKSVTNPEAVNPVPMGQAGNAWGFAYMRTTFLWAVNDINSISFVHRMLLSPGTGYLAYDISTDGGSTWTINNQVYNPTLLDSYNARYPQGVLYNPAGNTNPDDAYFSYFAPTLDGSNATTTDWGGYAWGTRKLETGSLPTQHNQISTNDFRQYLPSGFTLTQLGDTWMVDEENDGSSGSYVFTDNLIVGHGTWNTSAEEFDYTFDHLELEINPEDGINDVKIAFAPDGMTGWICALSDRLPALPYTSYHPILFKTTDGGQTWSDPMEVQLGGADGIEAIKEFISDSMLIVHFDPDPVPPRDEIFYYMGYHMDLAVDAWGNPHILGVVAIASEDGWWHYEGVFAMFHIYSTDQGATWKAFNIDFLQTFDITFTGSSGSDCSQYNRPQVATTPDGAIVFFSFLDTRFPGATENDQPNIYFREYFPSSDEHGAEVVDVTYLSNAMDQARWGCMSHYVFADVTGNNYECNIPFVYEELSNLDVSAPVQFWYIPDFDKSYVITGVDNSEDGPLASSVQNFPNPFRDVTRIDINLLKASDVGIMVYNTLGQQVHRIDFGVLQNGPHRLTLNLGNLDEGVYFYTLNAGKSRYNGKMIVR